MNLFDKYRAKLPTGLDQRATFETMAAEYQALITWLKRYDITGAEFRENIPDLYTDLMAAIDCMDARMIQGDIEGFRAAANQIKSYYLQAVRTLKTDRIERHGR